MQTQQLDELVAEIRSIFGSGSIPLHRPVFEGREELLLAECVDSNFVSSVGERVQAVGGTRAARPPCSQALLVWDKPHLASGLRSADLLEESL